MGIRRGNRAIIGWGRKVRKKMEKEKKAKVRAKKRAKQWERKKFAKFIKEQQKKTNLKYL